MDTERTDASLLETSLVHKGDFDILVHRYYDAIFRYLARAVGWDPAADMTQQVFLIAFKKRHTFAGEDSAKPWLFGITRNILRRWYRSEGRRHRAYDRIRGRAPMSSDLDDEIDTAVSANAMQDKLRVAFATLPARERDVFILYALGGLTYSEIADAVDVPIGTVRSRIHRARLRLRPLLESAMKAIDEQSRTNG